MPLIKTCKELKSRLDALDWRGQLALVPTMGALHRGHIALVEKALSENDNVVVSIFVNPTQFNNKEDLKKYPKSLIADVALLDDISKRLLIFAPSIKEVYGSDIASNSYDFEGLDKVMEGSFRAGHFNGVATVVEALFKMVGPNRAYFGEKDFQQLQIIKKLVAKKQLPIEIIGCPIVREANGLAMSSRNERLPKALRMEASFIYKTLQDAKDKFGTKSARFVVDWVKRQFEKHTHLELEYIQIADVDSLSPVPRKKKSGKYRAFVAVYAGGIRLIDNIALN